MQHHHMDKDDGNSIHHEVMKSEELATCRQIKIHSFPLDWRLCTGVVTETLILVPKRSYRSNSYIQ